jgi:hypothetical protein
MSFKINSVAFLAAISAIFIGFVVVESIYRVYLYYTYPYYFKDGNSGWYFQASPVKFSEEFGFEYVPGTYQGGAIYEGRVLQCWNPMQDWVINERGNSGRIRGSYQDAELKILVFGDSVTQRPRKNIRGEYMNWPNFLQDYLEQDLARSVHVVNFARDGYGVLQMFDLAAAKVAEWKPDLFIIAFISDDLTRDRFWRAVTSLDGRRRIMVSRRPDPHPSWNTSAEAFLLEPKATDQWCKRLLESASTDDPILEELDVAVAEGQRRAGLLADPFSLTHSYVLDQVFHGSPFHSIYNMSGPSQMPRHDLTSFALDDKFKMKIRKLKDSKIPYFIVHLATYSEIKSGTEQLDKGHQKLLIQSLEDLTERKIHYTLQNIDTAEFDVDMIPTDPENDQHPSLYGHQFYARTILNILLEYGMPDHFRDK